jgi:hypothetical protein
MSGVDSDARQEFRGRERGENGPRVLTDEEGRLWRVREVRFADAPPSLIFESETGFRRVRAYPTSWRSLSDGELFDLSWGT